MPSVLPVCAVTLQSNQAEAFIDTIAGLMDRGVDVSALFVPVTGDLTNASVLPEHNSDMIREFIDRSFLVSSKPSHVLSWSLYGIPVFGRRLCSASIYFSEEQHNHV